jgi:hypothetical protein
MVTPSSPAKKDETQESETKEDTQVIKTVKASEIYKDISANTWYTNAVDYVVSRKIMSGYDSKTFAPNDKLSRGMLAQILYNIEGNPTIKGSYFKDVSSSSWYANAAAWAKANGIVSGYADGTFGANDNITREQLAYFLYRYAVMKGYDVSVAANLSGYSDYGAISSYALTAMKWANANGLITGTSKTSLDPTGTATRVQVATVLMRFFENVAK